jgi:hypothetical protein
MGHHRGGGGRVRVVLGRGRAASPKPAAEVVAESDDEAEEAVEACPIAEAEPVDGAIDGAVRKMSRGIQDASTTVRNRFEKMRDATRNVAQASGVAARFRQDKGLDSAQIDVQVEEEGTVILKGQVPDVESKELAVESTRDIRGVVRVEDHLAVPPKPRVFSAPAGVATTPRARRVR